jgi:fructose-1,6-bisphosphatase/inositol monophosphatase family enzyme
MPSLHDRIAALIRQVASEVVLPRFRALEAHEIIEKSPGEIVTSVDREAERRLHAGLNALSLGAQIVGEEAAEVEPALLDDVGRGLVWLIDPLDGTGNFAAGREPFGIMIALVTDGVPMAGWLFDPVRNRLCHAERGKGAFCDGRVVRARTAGRDRPIAALGTHFMAPGRQKHVRERAATWCEPTPVPRCAAESYPRLVLGDDSIALFQRILPWDHAAGVLFLTEAGGKATHWDGTPYRVGGSGRGVLAAESEPAWEFAASRLLAPGAGIIDWKDETV